jgi:hypothetical protein
MIYKGWQKYSPEYAFDNPHNNISIKIICIIIFGEIFAMTLSSDVSFISAIDKDCN